MPEVERPVTADQRCGQPDLEALKEADIDVSIASSGDVHALLKLSAQALRVGTCLDEDLDGGIHILLRTRDLAPDAIGVLLVGADGVPNGLEVQPLHLKLQGFVFQHAHHVLAHDAQVQHHHADHQQISKHKRSNSWSRLHLRLQSWPGLEGGDEVAAAHDRVREEQACIKELKKQGLQAQVRPQGGKHHAEGVADGGEGQGSAGVLPELLRLRERQQRQAEAHGDAKDHWGEKPPAEGIPSFVLLRARRHQENLLKPRSQVSLVDTPEARVHGHCAVGNDHNVRCHLQRISEGADRGRHVQQLRDV
mmetsp:Transcript_74921/g.175743  ORF Transcript_74921/g.175743 Transcript_74921/m.175743 type:complete len:307 (+) Transcript_74921:722-1642(+)